MILLCLRFKMSKKKRLKWDKNINCIQNQDERMKCQIVINTKDFVTMIVHINVIFEYNLYYYSKQSWK